MPNQTRLLLVIPHRLRQAVTSYAEASRIYSAARDESGEGASTFSDGFIKQGTETIARISYNGKVWDSVEAWKAGDEPVFNPYESEGR